MGRSVSNNARGRAVVKLLVPLAAALQSPPLLPLQKTLYYIITPSRH